MGETIGIILAGGIGNRFKGDKPKQYYFINGKEMISYSIDVFKKASCIYDFVVVLNKEEYELGRISKQYNVNTVIGGSTRNYSFKIALDWIKEYYPHCEKVIENNAACPLINEKVLEDFNLILNEYDYVQSTYKITDALGTYKERTVNREDYFLIQSPDGYRFDVLYNCFNADNPNGHPAVQLPISSKGYNYFDFRPNIKVTYPEDIEIVELLLKRQNGMF